MNRPMVPGFSSKSCIPLYTIGLYRQFRTTRRLAGVYYMLICTAQSSVFIVASGWHRITLVGNTAAIVERHAQIPALEERMFPVEDIFRYYNSPVE